MNDAVYLINESTRPIIIVGYGARDAMDEVITHVLLNNAQLGKISKEQRAGEWPVWQTELHNPSFSAYAKLCGGKGVRVTKAEQLEAAIREGLEYPGPALIEVISDADLI